MLLISDKGAAHTRQDRGRAASAQSGRRQSETVNPKIPSSLDAAALSKMAERGQITGAVVDGPLALDNAISEEAATTKKIVSAVAGRANVLVVPDPYSYALPGHADARAALAAPVDGRLFFAGEACSRHDFTMGHGA